MLRHLAAAAALVGLAAVAGCSDRTEPSTTPLTGESAQVSTAPSVGISLPTFHPLTPAPDARRLAHRLAHAELRLHVETGGPGYDQAAFEAQLRYRQLARNPSWVPGVIGALPNEYRAEARLQVRARQRLRSVLTRLSPDVPAWRVAAPAPAADLLRFYKEAADRYGLDWQLLAAVNFVEPAFGKVQGLSTAGAQGPMQFMPSTWAAYGTGDVTDPHDAIMGAAHYLSAMGASDGESGVRRALLAYNNAQGYVDGILAYRRIITDDPAWFRAFYHWQVVYLSTIGDLWIPIGYHRSTPEPASAYAAQHPGRHLGVATD
ncbi:lytic transglycosylase domain-containing protein [Nocardioides montaniterrae]